MMKQDILASLDFVEHYIIHSYNCLQATISLNHNFILHLWYHAVFHVLITKVCRGIYISMRHKVALPRVVFTRDVKFTRKRGIYTRWKHDIFMQRGS